MNFNEIFGKMIILKVTKKQSLALSSLDSLLFVTYS